MTIKETQQRSLSNHQQQEKERNDRMSLSDSASLDSPDKFNSIGHSFPCIRTLPSNYPPSQSIHKYYFSTFHLAFSLSTLVTACDTSRIDVPTPPALCKWVQPRIYDQNRTARRNGNEIYLTGNSPIKRFHIIAIIV